MILFGHCSQPVLEVNKLEGHLDATSCQDSSFNCTLTDERCVRASATTVAAAWMERTIWFNCISKPGSWRHTLQGFVPNKSRKLSTQSSCYYMCVPVGTWAHGQCLKFVADRSHCGSILPFRPQSLRAANFWQRLNHHTLAHFHFSSSTFHSSANFTEINTIFSKLNLLTTRVQLLCSTTTGARKTGYVNLPNAVLCEL